MKYTSNLFPNVNFKDILHGNYQDQELFKLVSRVSSKSSKEEIAILFVLVVRNYVKFLKEIEAKYKGAKKYDNLLQKRINIFNDKVMKISNSLENKLPLSSRKKIRNLFRENIKSYIFQSTLLKRFYKKPLGYPGDYLMFEMIYDMKPLSRGFGRYFDNYIFNHDLIKAVISRKSKMKELLIKNIDGRKLSSQKILNIACGSCREIKELLVESNLNKNIIYFLLDQDTTSLKYAQNNLKLVDCDSKLNLFNRDILGILGFKGNRAKWKENNIDIIYSMGLVDYFRDNVLLRFISFFYKFLKPGGKFIIAACSSRNPNCYAVLRWFCEWHFHIRDKNNTKKIIENSLKVKSVNIEWESKHQIFFIIITK